MHGRGHGRSRTGATLLGPPFRCRLASQSCQASGVVFALGLSIVATSAHCGIIDPNRAPRRGPRIQDRRLAALRVRSMGGWPAESLPRHHTVGGAEFEARRRGAGAHARASIASKRGRLASARRSSQGACRMEGSSPDRLRPRTQPSEAYDGRETVGQ